MKKFLMVILIVVGMAGCALPQRGDELIATAANLTEPVWVRNAEPIIFESEDWFPTDEVENLLDSEVYQAGTFRETPFFIDKTDIRPYDRLYTRFAKNRYRAFEQ